MPVSRPLPDYLKKILTARVYDVAIESRRWIRHATCRAGWATTCCSSGRDQQPVFSFKLRGAYNKMAHLASNFDRA